MLRLSLRQKQVFLSVLLFAFVLGVFLPAIENDFIGYDDPDYLVSNAPVTGGLSWENLKWAFSSAEAANWHPLTWLSHQVDCELFGLRPWGHHLSSILLHSANALLLFLFLVRATGVVSASFVIAALFGVHPLRVESVAWIAERKDVLCGFFFFLALIAYSGYAKRSIAFSGVVDQPSAIDVELPEPPHRTPGWHRSRTAAYLLALFFFALALMSKPMAVSLPCVLLLLDFWPFSRLQFATRELSLRRLAPLVVEKLPFLVLAILGCAITFSVQRQGGALVAGLPTMSRIDNPFIAYSRYLEKLCWPMNLAPFYPPVPHWPVVAVAGSLVLLAGLTVAAWMLRRAQPWILAGWLWFLGTLLPVIGLVPAGEQSMADRYTYLPSIGVLLAVVSAFATVFHRPQIRFLLPGIATAAALFYTGLTWQQIGYWRDTETLFRHAIAVTKNNYLAYNNLGTALDQQGRLDEAVKHFEAALRIRPAYAQAHNNLGVALDKQGRGDLALDHYLEALHLNPNYAEAHNNLATVLEKQGRIEDATRHYRLALMLRPGFAAAHHNLGVALGHQGHVDEAVQELRAALRLQPDYLEAHNDLGVLFEKQGRLDEAIAEYAQVLRLKPEFARGHFNLGVALVRKGQLNEAAAQFQQALRLDPEYRTARSNLNAILELKKTSR